MRGRRKRSRRRAEGRGAAPALCREQEPNSHIRLVPLVQRPHLLQRLPHLLRLQQRTRSVTAGLIPVLRVLPVSPVFPALTRKGGRCPPRARCSSRTSSRPRSAAIAPGRARETRPRTSQWPQGRGRSQPMGSERRCLGRDHSPQATPPAVSCAESRRSRRPRVTPAGVTPLWVTLLGSR